MSRRLTHSRRSTQTFFPFPWKDDVVSQPVMAWNSGSAFAFLGPNASQMMSIDIYWKCFPVPKAIHSLTSGRIKHRLLYSVIAMTTTSLSTVLISTFCAPPPAAALRVQVSACLGPRGYNLAYFGWNYERVFRQIRVTWCKIRAFHKLLGNFLATSRISSSFFPFSSNFLHSEQFL